MTTRIVSRASRCAVAVLVMALLIGQAGYAAEAPTDAGAQAADTAARIAASTAPLSLADLAGNWGRHGFGLTINADGTGSATWRVYTWCKETAGKRPCDDMTGNTIVPGGKATIGFDHVEYRTLYGTVRTSTDQKMLPLGPVALTEYDYGLGELVTAPGLKVADADRSPMDRVLLGGPRYETAPEWVHRMSPLGA